MHNQPFGYFHLGLVVFPSNRSPLIKTWEIKKKILWKFKTATSWTCFVFTATDRAASCSSQKPDRSASPLKNMRIALSSMHRTWRSRWRTAMSKWRSNEAGGSTRTTAASKAQTRVARQSVSKRAWRLLRKLGPAVTSKAWWASRKALASSPSSAALVRGTVSSLTADSACWLVELKIFSVTTIKPKFVIVAAGFRSGSLVHKNCYESRISIPSLHVSGTSDEIIPQAMSLLLEEGFVHPKRFHHTGGHHFPATAAEKPTYVSFLQDQLQLHLEEKELKSGDPDHSWACKMFFFFITICFITKLLGKKIGKLLELKTSREIT